MDNDNVVDNISSDEALIDITSVEPGSVNSLTASVHCPFSSITSTRSTTSSSTMRRVTAAERLNRTLMFGESERPEDLGEDWCYVSNKNAYKRIDHATSDFDTFLHLVKGNLGAGLLALPMAIKDGGYIIGPVGMLVLALITMHCMVMLVESAGQLCKWNDIPALDYSETMMFALRERGAKPKLSKIAKYVVNGFLIITQFGFCSVYFVFIGDTFGQIMEETFCIDFNSRVWIVVTIVPILMFSWIKNLDNLAALSMLANVCTLVAIVVIFYDEIHKFTSDGSDKAAVKTPGELHAYQGFISIALCFGNIVYTFEGIGVVLPLENKMKTPEHAKYVIYIAMSLIITLCVTFGTLGYLVYGEDVRPSVMLNICPTNAITSFVFMLSKLMFIVAIFVSYTLQFYVPMDFLQPPLHSLLKLDYLVYKIPRYHKVITTVIDLGFRTVLVLFTAGLAVSIPDLSDLVSLIGSVASTSLALIFPSLIHLLTFWGYPDKKCLRCLPKPVWVIKDILIMMIGVIGLIFGTGAAVYGIVSHNEPKDICSAVNGFQTDCHLVHLS